ncbi:PREDICTED: maternal protein exuperantia [Nicrophorus vespilloides]|uniref:Maternal protein exuperantia n=1 Tax=Nicrophorus vespilloides TaxID=110193 RepID=A0ABM1MQL1_NICVS|nr:PREDICTED: maternal protein exuperantia [Nicrophorus vespilloides]XP_017776860.1 PREDICTED: maternal protein exuperantia [Nicrophorus vespilloides]XP_017776861.1 PREDICTED: maternal protein exuperantia [Nicrophorus vespilloides]
MVQSEHNVSESEDSPPMMEHKNLAKGVDEGNYKLIGWAADTTGRRLIDEICQIAAYTSDNQFSQYIMPFSDIRLLYRRRHSIRVMNMGKYRMLKDMRTNKFVKTKSEISALTDFVQWLENNRGDAKDGIILIFHEFHKSTPAMLLESLRRHNLSERFAAVVKGFANSFSLSQAKCANTTKSFSLRVMSKVLLNRDDDLSSAVIRAQTCFDIVMHLGQSERPDLESQGSGDANISNELLIKMIAPFTNPVTAEEDEIKEFKVLLDRQNTFKPVFGALLKATPTERQHASHLRRLLAENNIDYEKVKVAFESSAKDGLEAVLKAEILNAKEEDMNELLEILDCFFDPEKKAVQPKPRFYQNNGRFRKKSESRSDKPMNKNNNNNVKEESIEVKAEVEDEVVTVKIEGEAPIPQPAAAALPIIA